MANPMKPKQALLGNLAQIIIDLQDYIETDLHSSLKSAERLLGSPEVEGWLEEMKGRGHALGYAKTVQPAGREF
jgi:hypothetical protein